MRNFSRFSRRLNGKLVRNCRRWHHLEPGTTYQEMLGFGGAFTDASCYLLHLMDPDARHAFLANSMGPMGCAFLWGGPALERVTTRRRCTVTMTLRNPIRS